MLMRESVSFSGVEPDPFPQDATAGSWTNAQNIFFRNGESIRAGGDLAIFGTPSAVPLTLQYTETFGQPYWVFATADGVFVTDGTTETDITPASGWPAPVAGEVFTSCVLGGLAVVNGSARDPVWWPGAPGSKCEKLPGWFDGGRCLAMRTHKNFLFAIGRLDVGVNVVAWSDAAEPGAIPATWNPQADNLAGSAVLAPGVDPALDGLGLRDSFLVYKGESIWSFDFVPDTAVVFAVRKVFTAAGVAGTKAVTGDQQQHVYVDRMGDVFVTDGTMIRSLLDGRAQRAFYAELAEFPQGRLCAGALAREKVVLLAYPREGDAWATRGLVVDMSTLDFGFRDLPQVSCLQEGRYVAAPPDPSWSAAVGDWDGDRDAWNEQFSGATTDDLVAGTALGGVGGFVLLEADAAPDFLDGPVQAWAMKEGLSFGNGDRRKLVSRVWPRVRGGQGATLSFRIGGQEIEGGAISWSDPIPWTAGAEEPLSCFASGRFMAVEVSSAGGEAWALSSLDLVFQEAGRW